MEVSCAVEERSDKGNRLFLSRATVWSEDVMYMYSHVKLKGDLAI